MARAARTAAGPLRPRGHQVQLTDYHHQIVAGPDNMQKRVTVILLSAFLCSSSWAQHTNLLSTVSPKLKSFLAHSPAAAQTLAKAISDAFTNKAVRLFYFYPNTQPDRSTFEPLAFHFYPNLTGMPDVLICVAENQAPLDEFISILFEALNTKGDDRFAKLDEDARSGIISRPEYAREKLKVEFEAEKNTRDLLRALKLSKAETAGSHEHALYLGCPDTFEAFLPYLKKVNRHGDIFEAYQSLYDSLRKQH